MHLLLFESLVIHHLWAMCRVTSSLVTYVPLEHSDKHVPAWPLGQALQGPADKAAWMTLAPREDASFPGNAAILNSDICCDATL